MSPRYITMKTPKARSGGVEWDSDVNEDRGREMLLDRSFDDWAAENIQERTEWQEALTQVPQSNVFETAEQMDAE